MTFARIVRDEFARHRWIIPGIAIAASAALGSALPDLIALAQRVLS